MSTNVSYSFVKIIPHLDQLNPRHAGVLRACFHNGKDYVNSLDDIVLKPDNSSHLLPDGQRLGYLTGMDIFCFHPVFYPGIGSVHSKKTSLSF